MLKIKSLRVVPRITWHQSSFRMMGFILSTRISGRLAAFSMNLLLESHLSQQRGLKIWSLRLSKVRLRRYQSSRLSSMIFLLDYLRRILWREYIGSNSANIHSGPKRSTGASCQNNHNLIYIFKVEESTSKNSMINKKRMLTLFLRSNSETPNV